MEKKEITTVIWDKRRQDCFQPGAWIKLKVFEKLNDAVHPDLFRLVGLSIFVVQLIQLFPIHDGPRFPIVKIKKISTPDSLKSEE